VAAVGREHQHVGEGADAHRVQQLQGGGLVEGHRTRVGLGRGLDGQRHQPIVNRHAVHTGTQGGHDDRANLDRLAWRAQLKHIHRAVGSIDHEQPLALRVEGGDFSRSQRCAAVAADLLQGQGDGRAFVIFIFSGASGQQGRAERGVSQPSCEGGQTEISDHELRLCDGGRTSRRCWLVIVTLP